MIALRRFWLERFGQGAFADTQGIAELPGGIRAAVYRQGNALLLACANTTGQASELIITGTGFRSAACYTAGETVSERPVQLQQAEGKTRVPVPKAPLSLICLTY